MRKILIVEDDDASRKMLAKRLKTVGYKLMTAVNGKQGVKKAVMEQPELIIMDMAMPVMDGWEATKLLKAYPETKDIPILALTAFTKLPDMEKSLEAGCDDFETKPVKFEHLLRKVRQLLHDEDEFDDDDDEC